MFWLVSLPFRLLFALVCAALVVPLAILALPVALVLAPLALVLWLPLMLLKWGSASRWRSSCSRWPQSPASGWWRWPVSRPRSCSSRCCRSPCCYSSAG